MAKTRDLNAEQQFLKDFLSDAGAQKRAGFSRSELDAALKGGAGKQKLEQEINLGVYGEQRPVFEKDFGIPELRNDYLKGTLGSGLLPGIFREQVEKLQPTGEFLGNLGKQLEGIKNPAVRNRLISLAQGGRQDQINNMLQGVAGLFQAQTGVKGAALENAQGQFASAEDRSLAQGAREQGFRDLQRELEIRQPFELAQINASKTSSTGYGTDVVAPTTVKDFLKLGFDRVPTESGGFVFKDLNGNNIDVVSASIQSGIPVKTLLSGSTDPVDTEYLAGERDITELGGVTEAVLEGVSDEDLIQSLIDVLSLSSTPNQNIG